VLEDEAFVDAVSHCCPEATPRPARLLDASCPRAADPTQRNRSSEARAAESPRGAPHPSFAQHFLNFLPLPHGHGSFLPVFIFDYRRVVPLGHAIDRRLVVRVRLQRNVSNWPIAEMTAARRGGWFLRFCRRPPGARPPESASVPSGVRNRSKFRRGGCEA
jgi:hypothetical protein